MSHHRKQEIDVRALVRLKGARPRLTAQQYRTLRGLRKILLLEGSNAIKAHH